MSHSEDSGDFSESEQQFPLEKEVFWGKKAAEYYGGSDAESAADLSDAEKELREKAEKRQKLLTQARNLFHEDDSSSSESDEQPSHSVGGGQAARSKLLRSIDDAATDGSSSLLARRSCENKNFAAGKEEEQSPLRAADADGLARLAEHATTTAQTQTRDDQMNAAPSGGKNEQEEGSLVVAAENQIEKNKPKNNDNDSASTTNKRCTATRSASNAITARNKQFWLSKNAPELQGLLQEYVGEMNFLQQHLLPCSDRFEADKAFAQDMGPELKTFVDARISFAKQYLAFLSFYLHLKKDSVCEVLEGAEKGTVSSLCSSSTPSAAGIMGSRTTATLSGNKNPVTSSKLSPFESTQKYITQHPVFEQILALKELKVEYADKDDMLVECLGGSGTEDEEEQDLHAPVDPEDEDAEASENSIELDGSSDAEDEEEESDHSEDVFGGLDGIDSASEAGTARLTTSSKKHAATGSTSVKTKKERSTVTPEENALAAASNEDPTMPAGGSEANKSVSSCKRKAEPADTGAASLGKKVKSADKNGNGAVRQPRNQISLQKECPYHDATLGARPEKKGQKQLQQYMTKGQKLLSDTMTTSSGATLSKSSRQKTGDAQVEFKQRSAKNVRIEDSLPADFFAADEEGEDHGSNPKEQQEEEMLKKTKHGKKKATSEVLGFGAKGTKEKTALTAVDPGSLTEGQKQHLELEDGEQRFATKKILQNKGLVRIRPKKDRNSRVKHRRKYEKAVKKRKTVVQTMRTAENLYSGEMTGIRTTVVKSHKL
ncbi:unnamed protein product [Amoebophrya sp. A120]|nr:unnamed protein product [Amoebophrya sp. A120]|eukprot:GSA120T00021812001.1